MSWASSRQTTRVEDRAYSLLGIFDVHMALLYGEGGKKAFFRLQLEIIKSSNDDSIFAWTDDELPISGMLAPWPSAFASSGDIRTPSIGSLRLGKFVSSCTLWHFAEITCHSSFRAKPS